MRVFFLMDSPSFSSGGGNVKIENRKVELGGVKSRIGSLDNARHTPKGGDKKVTCLKQSIRPPPPSLPSADMTFAVDLAFKTM